MKAALPRAPRTEGELAEGLASHAHTLQKLALERMANKDDSLLSLFHSVRTSLDPQLTQDNFSDAVGQLLAYGLLAQNWLSARLPGSRAPFASCLSNVPVLSDLFTLARTAAGRSVPDEFGRAIKDLAAFLERIDLQALSDPEEAGSLSLMLLHFYEAFLGAYAPQDRQQRGVFFTPRALASYVVRSVDALLRDEFQLEDGLASTDSWAEVAARLPHVQLPFETAPFARFVSVLDPAAGTGAFLLECVSSIEHTMKSRYARELLCPPSHPEVVERWTQYVHTELVPRLVGFEVMLPSYAIAHLLLALRLKESGVELRSEQPLRIYLTDTLELPASSLHKDPGQGELFPYQQVAALKHQPRFTVVLGNPPYSASLSKPRWLLEKMQRWKVGLNERKIDLNREEWKFVAYAQHLAHQVPCAVWCYVINRDFLDGVAKRAMRSSLEQTFVLRHIIDLHGDAKGDVADENVFKISQGVCIVTGVRGGVTQETCHRVASLTGSRSDKLACLSDASRVDAMWKTHTPVEPYHRWVGFSDQQVSALEAEYATFYPLSEIFTVFSSGIQTKRDALCIQFSPEELWSVVSRLDRLEEEEARNAFSLPPDGRDWTISAAKRDLRASGPHDRHVMPILYRPFDVRFTYLTGRTKGFLAYPRRDVMQHLQDGDNVGLLFNRQVVGNEVSHFGASRIPTCHGTFYLGNKGQDYLAPLYLRTFDFAPSHGPSPVRRSNLSTSFVENLCTRLGEDVAPEQAFHYLFGIVHSTQYRARYRELLKRDFPRIPLTENRPLFAGIASLGRRLLEVHLLEQELDSSKFPRWVGPSAPKVTHVAYVEAESAVYLDAERSAGFMGIAASVWRLRVGGYQVCEKWLKDRRGRTLSTRELEYYARLVASMGEMTTLVPEIDLLIARHGGLPGAFHPPRSG